MSTPTEGLSTDGRGSADGDRRAHRNGREAGAAPGRGPEPAGPTQAMDAPSPHDSGTGLRSVGPVHAGPVPAGPVHAGPDEVRPPTRSGSWQPSPGEPWQVRRYGYGEPGLPMRYAYDEPVPRSTAPASAGPAHGHYGIEAMQGPPGAPATQGTHAVQAGQGAPATQGAQSLVGTRAGQAGQPGGPALEVDRGQGSGPGRRPGAGEAPGDPPRDRGLLAALGLVAVAVVGSVGGWALGSSGSGRSPAASQPAPSVAVTPSRTSAPTSGVSEAVQADAGQAVQQLEDGGVRVRGEAEEAWSWTDSKGRNVVVLSKDVTERDGDQVRAATLYVTHAAGRNGDFEELRRLTDPGTRNCDTDFGLDFVKGSVSVADRDRDGNGEASVGWWASCRGDPGPYTIKLAVLSEGEYFILRGQGQVATDPALPPGISVPEATFKPDPAQARWPRGTYDETVQLFERLFR